MNSLEEKKTINLGLCGRCLDLKDLNPAPHEHMSDVIQVEQDKDGRNKL
jgi:hypothetical protein